jgi:hypothetical protein
MTKGLMYRGGPTTKTSARIAGALIKEFGKDDGLVLLDWLIDRLQAADGLYGERNTKTIAAVEKEKTDGRRKHH